MFETVMPVGAADSLPTVTFSILCELVPQELDAVTPMMPFAPVMPVVTSSEVVPCPDIIVQPAGTVQLYDSVPLTAAME